MELPGILLSLLLWCNATWLFLSMVLPETYPFSKRKREKESCFATKSKRGLFSFPSCQWFFFSSNDGACYIKTRAHAPNVQQHRMPGMPCLVECFLQ